MNQSLTRQKKELQLAAGYIQIIEDCDAEIARSNNVEYFKAVRTEAIERYASAMSNLVEEAIIGSKVLQPVA